jgi:hypothetical protein
MLEGNLLCLFRGHESYERAVYILAEYERVKYRCWEVENV